VAPDYEVDNLNRIGSTRAATIAIEAVIADRGRGRKVGYLPLLMITNRRG